MTPPIRPDPPSFYAMLVDALKRHAASTAPPRRPALPPPDYSANAKLDSLATSPFADSLYRMAGTPSTAVVDANPGVTLGGVLGEYEKSRGPNQDTLYVTFGGLKKPLGQPPSSSHLGRMEQPEYILAHELGHRMYSYPQNAPTPAPTAEQDSVYNANAGKGRRGYWDTNPNEHFAEAFANAVSFLRATAQKPAGLDMPATTDAMSTQYERAVPGTALMVRRLLSDPQYANHPLNTSAVVPTAQRDVTATPMQSILAQALLAAQKKRQGGGR